MQDPKVRLVPQGDGVADRREHELVHPQAGQPFAQGAEKLLRGPITASRHPTILTYFHIRSCCGAPSLLVLGPLVTFLNTLRTAFDLRPFRAVMSGFGK